MRILTLTTSENTDLNYEAKAVLHVNSPFQSVCVCEVQGRKIVFRIY